MKNLENKKIVEKAVEVYDKAAEVHGVSSSAVLWDNPQTQYFRFVELIKFIDLNDAKKSILDLGCGNCELYKFLNFMGYRGKYTGFDINEKLITQAKKRFANIEVYNTDILSDPVNQKFDNVLVSGLFNVNLGQSQDWVYEFIKKMFEFCNESIVFNLISTHVSYKDEKMFYMDPSEVLNFCIKNLSKRVTISHHNLPYNYTVTVFKNENWKSI